jgi:hypothetical protein
MHAWELVVKVPERFGAQAECLCHDTARQNGLAIE